MDNNSIDPELMDDLKRDRQFYFFVIFVTTGILLYNIGALINVYFDFIRFTG